jgi:6,7-dimethyl-8-ribityllumazine synthase
MANARTARPLDLGPARGARVLIVEARFYDEIADLMLEGVTAKLAAHGASFEVATVPGALELATAAAIVLEAGDAAGEPYDGVVALGCVVRGETTHYDIVSEQSCRLLGELSFTRRLPLGNGVLTVEDYGQALARAQPDEMDKGGGAAEACLALIALKRRAASGGRA